MLDSPPTSNLSMTQPLPSPHPSTSSGALPDVDADLVTPGLFGFLTLFLSAVAVYFLARSMARRVQRVNHRAVPGAPKDSDSDASTERSGCTNNVNGRDEGPKDQEQADSDAPAPAAAETDTMTSRKQEP